VVSRDNEISNLRHAVFIAGPTKRTNPSKVNRYRDIDLDVIRIRVSLCAGNRAVADTASLRLPAARRHG
jgi:hypothetical protein